MTRWLIAACLSALLSCVVAPDLKAQDYTVSVEQYAGLNDTLFLEFYIQLDAGAPFALGPSDFLLNVPSPAVDLTTVGIRPISADSGAFNGPLSGSGPYLPITAVNSTFWNGINVRVMQNPASTGPGVLIEPTRKLLARVFVIKTDPACNVVLNNTWETSPVAQSAYGVPFPSPFDPNGPGVNWVDPPPFNFFPEVSPPAYDVCYNAQDLQFNSTIPGAWTVLSDSGSVFDGVSSGIDSVFLDVAETSVDIIDTVILTTGAGACTDTAFVNVNGRPLISGPGFVCSDTVDIGFSSSIPATFALSTDIGSSIASVFPDSVALNFGTTPIPEEDTLYTESAFGCRDTQYIDIGANPTAFITGNPAPFIGSINEPYSTPYNSDYSFVWNTITPNATITGINFLQNQATLAFPGNGLDTLTLLVTDNITGCTNRDTFSINVTNCPPNDVIGDTLVCNNEVLTYSDTDPSTSPGFPVWSLGTAGSTIGSTIDVPTNDVINVTFGPTGSIVTDTLILNYLPTCFDTALIEVRPDPIFVTPVADTNFCNFETVSFETTYPVDWRILTPGSDFTAGIDTTEIEYTFNAVETDTIEASFRSCTTSIEVTVDAPTPVTISGPPVVIAGDLGMLFTANSPAVNGDYTWTSITSNNIINFTPNPADTDSVVIDFGFTLAFDTLIVELEDTNGCIDADTFEIETQNCSATNGTFGPDTVICQGESTFIYTVGPVGTIQWQDSSASTGVWQDVPGPFASSQVLITPTLTDTTYYRMITDVGLCQDTSNSFVTVAVTPEPEIDSIVITGVDTVCINGTTTLEALGVNPTASIQWQTSLTGVAGWTDVTTGTGFAAAVFQPAAMNNSRYFRAQVASPCDTIISNSVFVAVNDSARGTFPTALADICANGLSQPLGATVTNGTGAWTTSGGGGFVNSNLPSTRYVSDSTDGGQTITLTWTISSTGCPDSVLSQPLNVLPLPASTFDIQPLAICVSDTSDTLGASVQIGTGTWFTPNGAGSFEVPTDPNSRYISAPADAGQDIVLQWLTSNGVCPVDTLEQTLFVGEEPFGNFSQTLPSICAGSRSDTLEGFVSVGTGVWSSNGDGAFVLVNDTTAIYQSASTDANQEVSISFVVSSGACESKIFTASQVVDTASLGTFTTDLDTICAGGSSPILDGIALSGDGYWAVSSNGSGLFSPDTLDTQARYISDVTDASSDLDIFWIVQNGACPPDTTTQPMFVESDIVVGAFPGPIPDVCANDSTIPLGASVGAGSGQWQVSPSGTGTFVDPFDPNSQFLPGPSASGNEITLTWRVVNGTCAPLLIDQRLNVFAEPAGQFLPEDLDPVCFGDTSKTLIGFLTTGDTAFWTSDGAGFFLDPASPTTRYVPAFADGGTTVTVCYVVKNGPCDSLTICKPLAVGLEATGSIQGLPPETICAGSVTDPLNATVVNGTGAWSTPNGIGDFSVEDSPNATYNSVLSEAGNRVYLDWTVSSPGCRDTTYRDSVDISSNTIDSEWDVDLGRICVGDTTDTLGGAVDVTLGFYNWSTDPPGLGTFINDPGNDPQPTQFVPTIGTADTFDILLTVQDLAAICNAKVYREEIIVNQPGDGTIISGNDTVCFPDQSSELEATTAYGIGSWFSSGAPGGALTHPDSIITRYQPGFGDAGGDDVNLFWVADAGACPNDTDTVVVVVQRPPNGGFFQSLSPVCAGSQTPTLLANIVSGTGRWATTGAGFFTPDSLTDLAKYVSDTSEGGDTVQLYWIVENGVCVPDTNAQSVEILDITVDGAFTPLTDSIYCEGDTTEVLNATINIGLGFWTTDGFGLFRDPVADTTNTQLDDVLNAEYIPIGLDFGDTVNLTFNIIDSSGFCTPKQLEREIVVNEFGAGAVLNEPERICEGDTSDPIFSITTNGTGFWYCDSCAGAFTDTLGSPTRYISDLADTAINNFEWFWRVEKPGCEPVDYPVALIIDDSSQGVFPPLVTDTICAGRQTDTLSALAVHGSGIWDCDNCEGGFKNPQSGDAQYISSAQDGDQTVELQWVVSNGVCPTDTQRQFLWVDTLPLGQFNTFLPEVCELDTSVNLNAQVIAGTGFWTCTGCNGAFIDSLNPNTRYVPGPGDGDTVVVLNWNIFNGDCDTVQYSLVQPVQSPPSGNLIDTSLTIICAGTTSGQLTGDVDPGSGGRWYDSSGNGQFSSLINPNSTYTSSALDVGDTITLTWRVGTSLCVNDSLDFTKPVFVGGNLFPASILAPDDSVCSGDTINFQLSGDSVQLRNPSGLPIYTKFLNGVTDTFSYKPSNSGNFILYSQNLSTGCITTDTLLVSVIPGIAISLNVPPFGNQICSGDSVLIELSGGGGILDEFVWEPEEAFVDSAPDIDAYFKPLATTPGFSVSARTANGCRDTVTASYSVLDAPQPVVSVFDVCEGDSSFFVFENANQCVQIGWYNGGLGEVTDNNTPLDPNNPFFFSGVDSVLLAGVPALDNVPYTYSVSCLDTQGCVTSLERNFRVYANPIAEFQVLDTTGALVDGIVLPFNNRSLDFVNQSQNAVDYIWFFDDEGSGNLNTDTTENPTHFFTRSGFFTIALVAENPIGCVDFDIKSQFIEVLPERFFFPTGFSPNGDGRNDLFRPLPVGERRFVNLKIIDRWGQVVWEENDTEGWDGFTPEGRPFDAGTYLYSGTIELETEGLVEYSGYITLIR